MESRINAIAQDAQSRDAKDLAYLRLTNLLSTIKKIPQRDKDGNIIEHIEPHPDVIIKKYPELLRFINDLSTDTSLPPRLQINRLLLEFGAVISLVAEKKIYRLNSFIQDMNNVNSFIQDMYNALFAALEAEFDVINNENIHKKHFKPFSYSKPENKTAYNSTFQDALATLSANTPIVEDQLCKCDALTIDDILRFQSRLNECIDVYFYQNGELAISHSESAAALLRAIADRSLVDDTNVLQEFHRILTDVNNILHDSFFMNPAHSPELFQHIVFNEIARIEECRVEFSPVISITATINESLKQLDNILVFGKDNLRAAKKWNINLSEKDLAYKLELIHYCETHAKRISNDICSLHFTINDLHTLSSFKELLEIKPFTEEDNPSLYKNAVLAQVAELKEKLHFWNARNLFVATIEGFIDAYCNAENFNSHDAGTQDIANDVAGNLEKVIRQYEALLENLARLLEDYSRSVKEELEKAHDASNNEERFILPNELASINPKTLRAGIESLPKETPKKAKNKDNSENAGHVDFWFKHPTYVRMSALTEATNHYSFHAIKGRLNYVLDHRGVRLPDDAKEIIYNCNELGADAYPPKKPSVLPKPSGVTSGENNKQNGAAVESRNPENTNLTSINQDFSSSQAFIQSNLSAPRSPRQRRPAPAGVLVFKFDLNRYAHRPQEGSRAKKILVGIGIGLVIGMALTGLAAGIIFGAPFVLGAIGAVGVICILAGIPTVSAVIGLISGIFWGRRPQNNALPALPGNDGPGQHRPAYIPVSSEPSPRSSPQASLSRSGSSSKLFASESTSKSPVLSASPTVQNLHN